MKIKYWHILFLLHYQLVILLLASICWVYRCISTIFGGNGFPSVSRTPYITVSKNSFGTFLGYVARNYPTIGSGGDFGVVLAGASIASFTFNKAGSGYKKIMPIFLNGSPGIYSGFPANVVNGVVTSIIIGNCSGYSTVPTVCISGGGGTGVNIACTVAAGSVSSFTI